VCLLRALKRFEVEKNWKIAPVKTPLDSRPKCQIILKTEIFGSWGRELGVGEGYGKSGGQKERKLNEVNDVKRGAL
jgi:hypothetical protein